MVADEQHNKYIIRQRHVRSPSTSSRARCGRIGVPSMVIEKLCSKLQVTIYEQRSEHDGRSKRVLVTETRSAEMISRNVHFLSRGSETSRTSTNAGLHNTGCTKCCSFVYSAKHRSCALSSENTPFDLSPNLSYRILQIYSYMQSTAACSCKLPPMILQLQL
jgi:hypothetical protein